MPVSRTPISRSQLAELFGLEPSQLVGIERTTTGWCVISEGDEMQTTGTFPEVSDNKTRGPRNGGKKR